MCTTSYECVRRACEVQVGSQLSKRVCCYLSLAGSSVV